MTTRLVSRIAGLGTALALGSATLVAVSPAADAATGKAVNYTCTTPTLGDLKVTVATKVALPKSVKKGTKIRSKRVVLTVVLPEETVDGLRFLGITSLSGSATGAKAKVGAKKVALKGVSFDDQAVPASGTMKIKAKGKTAPVTLRKRGKQAISIPKTFKLTASSQNGPLVSNAPCSLDAGQKTKIGTIKVK